MKKTLHTLIVLCLLGQYPAVTAAAEWEKAAVLNIERDLHNLVFISDKIGFVIECDHVQSSWSSNAILKTEDGGKSWKYGGFGSGSELCPSSVFFVNSDLGYFAARGSAQKAQGVKTTTDGGTTWLMADDATSGLPFEATALYFTDDATGFAGAPDAIYKTANGGKSWSMVHNSAGMISSIVFTSAQIGYAVGYDNPLILKTVDGGNSWTSIANQYSLLSVAFSSANKGYAVGFDGTIVYTNDAGATWNVPASTDGNSQILRSVCCLDDNTCFAVGDSGTILKTIDGGATWTRQISGTNQHLKSVACPDNTCFAVGDNGIVLQTTVATDISETTPVTTGMSIYPNPSNSDVTIRLATTLGNATVSVFNYFGQQTVQMHNVGGNSITIDKQMNPGLYFFTIQQGGQNMFKGNFIIE